MAGKAVKAKEIKQDMTPLVGIIMGSQSDWATMENAANVLDSFCVPYESLIVSAHRTPNRLFAYAHEAAARGVKVIIAGAGGAAHLPGMAASMTTVPVLGVPVMSRTLEGLDSLLSIAQMPAGVPVGTLAVGNAGAVNAALLAVSILSLENKDLSALYKEWREVQTASVGIFPFAEDEKEPKPKKKTPAKPKAKKK
ncbi:MAG: 5-(carboxyamino)imidazole ribonucleotide mutase [Alphaproteobacteria bacterium]|nr:5-(carboxyamino)imidazole ribonucleotide mutase [Alphaproteobacteria bacterium]